MWSIWRHTEIHVRSTAWVGVIIIVFLVINACALLLSLVHRAEYRASWEFPLLPGGYCSQQHSLQGGKWGFFSWVCSLSLSACHDSCSTCEGPLATHCTSCSLPLALRQGQCLRGCGEGFYQDHDVCRGKQCALVKFLSCCKSPYLTWLLLEGTQSAPGYDTDPLFYAKLVKEWIIPTFAYWLLPVLRKIKFSQVLCGFTSSGFTDLGTFIFSVLLK